MYVLKRMVLGCFGDSVKKPAWLCLKIVYLKNWMKNVRVPPVFNHTRISNQSFVCQQPVSTTMVDLKWPMGKSKGTHVETHLTLTRYKFNMEPEMEPENLDPKCDKKKSDERVICFISIC